MLSIFVLPREFSPAFRNNFPKRFPFSGKETGGGDEDTSFHPQNPKLTNRETLRKLKQKHKNFRKAIVMRDDVTMRSRCDWMIGKRRYITSRLNWGSSLLRSSYQQATVEVFPARIYSPLL